ncbi:retrovirus-related pol polyprotein from transposon TNT 1-94 [Tanacetum coccineum]
MARQCTQPKRPKNSAWFKENLMLVEAQESGQVLNEEQLADPGVVVGQDTQTTMPINAAFQTNDLDAFDSNCDEAPGAQAVLMSNLSSYDSDVISETESASVQNNTSSDQQNAMIMSVFDAISDQVVKCAADNPKHRELDASFTAELESYKERVKQFEERQNVDLNNREKYIESQMNDMILSKNAKFDAFQKEIDTLKFNLSKHDKEYASLITKIDALKKQSKEKEDKYIEEAIDLEKQKKELENIVYKKHDVISVADYEETLLLAEESRLKMMEKQNDPVCKDKKVNISLINYVDLNNLSKHFGKHFVPQKELSAEQAFWLRILNPISEQLVVQATPVKTEAPRELQKITPDAITAGAWGFEHTKGVFMTEVIPFLKSLKELFSDFVNGINIEINEVKMVFNQMEAVVEQCSVDNKYFEIEKNELSLDNDRLLEHIICQDVMNVVFHANVHSHNVLPANNNSLEHDNSASELLKHKNDCLMELLISQDLVHTAVNSLTAINDYKSMEQSFLDEYEENVKLQIELDKKNDMIEKLKAKNVSIEKLKEHIAKLKGKNVVDSVQTVHNSNVVTTKLYKLDFQPLSPRIKNNRDAHVDYLKVTQEHTDILLDTVEQARALKPLDNALDYAYKYTQRIHELLVCVCAACPSSKYISEKLVDVIPMNITRKVGFAESSDTSKDKTQNQVKPQAKQTTNNSVSPSTGVSCSTKASGSKPKSNTKKDRITQTSSSNKKKNKVEDHPRIAKSSLNNMKRVSKPVCNANVKHSVLNANSKLICVTCHEYQLRAKRRKCGNLLLGNVTISWVYYVEGLGHNLFSVVQFCDSNLEVAFRKHTCYVRNLKGSNLLSGSKDINLYTILLDDMLKSSPICLLYKASKTKSWLWHRRLSHLNFGTLNQLAKQGLVRGLTKLKFEKDHLCSACSIGKSKKHSHKPKAKDTNQEKLYLLHMDLCGPIRVESINGKKYILVIVDNYSRFTWVKFLRSKDETPEVIIKCLKQIQVCLNATVRNIRIDNRTEFVNQNLKDYYEIVRITHQTSVAHTPQKNGIVERWNRTLVEAARIMLIFSKAPLYLWAEAVSTACYTQNRSVIRLRYNKTPYELMHDKKPDLSFLYVFGLLCYLTNDSKDLGKLKPKADIGIFVGYAPAMKSYRIYNKRTRQIMETIHVTVDELTAMAS